MRNVVALWALILGLVAVHARPLQAQLIEDGFWTGHLVSPTSELFEVGYRVATDMGTQTITMEWTRGPTTIYDFQRDRDTLWFSWDMEVEFRLNCILTKQKEDFRGACRGPFGSFGLLTMFPPDMTATSEDIDVDALSPRQALDELYRLKSMLQTP